MHTNEQKTLVINKLLAICDNEILYVDIPDDSSFEDLPFECQFQYMCFVKCAGLFSSIGESEQAVNSYLRVCYAKHVFCRRQSSMKAIFRYGRVFLKWPLPTKCMKALQLL